MEGVHTFLLVVAALALVFFNFWLVYKTHIKPLRKKDRRIDSPPNQFPYSGHSIGDKDGK